MLSFSRLKFSANFCFYLCEGFLDDLYFAVKGVDSFMAALALLMGLLVDWIMAMAAVDLNV